MNFTDDRYYLSLAAAFVRGRILEAPRFSDAELLNWGYTQGLRLHKFKRTSELPRVRRVQGLLRGLLQPNGDLLDIGSGRGVFLWPLLDAWPDLRVTAVDRDERRVRDLQAVTEGGIVRLTALQADAESLTLPTKSKDIVTMLEVLEHLDRPEAALKCAMTIARQAVILSVPSREDNNPEHIHLFNEVRLRAMLTGARRVTVEYVLNHIIVLALL